MACLWCLATPFFGDAAVPEGTYEDGMTWRDVLFLPIVSPGVCTVAHTRPLDDWRISAADSVDDGIRKQAIEFFLDYLVTLTHTCLQTGTVEYTDPATAVVD